MSKPTARKSGAYIPQSQRHTVRIDLRVAPEVRAQLAALCGDTWSYSDFVSALIESETRRARRRK